MVSTVFLKLVAVMLEIAVVVVCGVILRRRSLPADGTKLLSGLIINLFLPCLIVHHLLSRSGDVPWQALVGYPLLGIVISLIGALVAHGLLRFLPQPYRREVSTDCLGLIAFQNCGYLPLVLVSSAFPPEQAAGLTTQILLFIQGYNLIFWSIGVNILSGKSKQPFSWGHLASPPLLALLGTVVLLMTRGGGLIPAPVLRALQLMGSCTMPVALLVLGAVLAECWHRVQKIQIGLWLAIAGKNIVMPALALGIISWFGLPSELSWIVLIQAAMPSAINLSVVSAVSQDRCGMISQGVILSHLASVITVPFFLSLHP